MEQRFDGLLQGVHVGESLFSFGAIPGLRESAASDPQTEVLFLVVVEAPFTVVLSGVSAPKFEQPQIGLLVVRVPRDGLQTLEDQTLTHGAQI